MNFWLIAAAFSGIALLAAAVMFAPLIRNKFALGLLLVAVTGAASLGGYYLLRDDTEAINLRTNIEKYSEASDAQLWQRLVNSELSPKAWYQLLATRLNARGTAQEWLAFAGQLQTIKQEDAALTALKRAYQLEPSNQEVLIGFAQTLALKPDPNSKRQAASLLRQLTTINGQHQGGLLLAGFVHRQLQEPDIAAGYWRRLLTTLPEDSPSRARIREQLANIESPGQSASEDTAVASQAERGEITIEAEYQPELLAGLPESARLFVIARAAGAPGPPIAVKALAPEALTTPLSISDENVMLAGSSLKTHNLLQIELRISLSGNPIAANGDIFGKSAEFAPDTVELPLLIELDSTVGKP